MMMVGPVHFFYFQKLWGRGVREEGVGSAKKRKSFFRRIYTSCRKGIQQYMFARLLRPFYGKSSFSMSISHSLHPNQQQNGGEGIKKEKKNKEKR
jgi:hypothetical protein